MVNINICDSSVRSLSYVLLKYCYLFKIRANFLSKREEVIFLIELHYHQLAYIA